MFTGEKDTKRGCKGSVFRGKGMVSCTKCWQELRKVSTENLPWEVASWRSPVTSRSTVEAKGRCEWILESERGGIGPKEQRTLFQDLL